MNNGGPVYPRSGATPAQALDDGGGITIRDHFAGIVLARLADFPVSEETTETYMKGVARTCYQLADAMIAEREKGQ